MNVSTQKELNIVISSLLNIDEIKFQAGLDKGQKPSKLAIKLGANQTHAQYFAGLKLAISAEEINEAYASHIRSCMTDEPVGEFYAMNGIGVIWGPQFRILVNTSNGVLGSSSYGMDRDYIHPILSDSGLFAQGEFYNGEHVIYAERVEDSNGQEMYKVHRSPIIYNESTFIPYFDEFVNPIAPEVMPYSQLPMDAIVNMDYFRDHGPMLRLDYISGVREYPYDQSFNLYFPGIDEDDYDDHHMYDEEELRNYDEMEARLDEIRIHNERINDSHVRMYMSYMAELNHALMAPTPPESTDHNGHVVRYRNLLRLRECIDDEIPF